MITAACNAMATRFEMILHGEDAVALRAAADQAFHEIERLHRQLSFYSPSSDISSINAHAARRPVQVEPELFALLQLARRIYEETQGRFDVTIAPLIRCWGFMGGTGALPDEGQIAEAQSKVGMQHVLMDEDKRTIKFNREGMMIDLGSIGKGYALDLAADVLVEAGVQSALVHGGTSTICAIGAPPDQEGWKIAIDAPSLPGDRPPTPERARAGEAHRAQPPLAVVSLKGETLSVSGVHGKCFRAEGKVYGHVIDPRTGWPVDGALLSAVVLPSAAESDAFSTALLLSGSSGQAQIGRMREGMRTLVAEPDTVTGRLRVTGQGIVATAV